MQIRKGALALAAAALVQLAPPLTPEVQAQAQASPYTSATRLDALGRVTGTITPDPDGAGSRPHLAVRNSYDAAGRLVTVENGTLAAWQSEAVAPASWSGFTVLQRTDTAYDAMGRKLRDTLTVGGAVRTLTQYSYDRLGRLECTAVRMNPGAFGSPPASACTLGAEGSDGPDRITRNQYDAAGQLLQVQRAYGTPLQQNYATYSYDLNGLRTSVTDANGNRAEMTYDGHDRQRRWIFPNAQTGAPNGTATSTTGDYEEYGYDYSGNRTSLRKRDGRTINYQYDNLNRLLVKTVPQSATGGAGYSVHYRYDLRNLQTDARFDSLQGPGVVNTYDGLGRLNGSTTSMAGTSRTLTYEYDAAGRRTRIVHPGGGAGASITYEYDVLGALTRIRETNGAVLANNFFDSYARQWARGYPVAYTHIGYNSASRLESLQHGLNGTSADQLIGFGYNAAGQIVARSMSNEAYVATAPAPGSDSYAVNRLNQYEQVRDATFGYDDNGNLDSDSGPGHSTSYVYDAENRLVSGSGTRTASLVYDPLGRLFSVTGPSSATQFLYDGDALVAEYDTAGNLLRRYVHGADPRADDPLIWYEGANGTPRGLFSDHQGSIVAVAAADGTPLAMAAYDAWGIPNAGSVGVGAGRVGRFGYTGQIWIPELRMWHYKARIYSPTLGRFLQTDPIGYDDQINLYAYVHNDPVNYTDPDGREGANITSLGIRMMNESRAPPREVVEASFNIPVIGPFMEGMIAVVSSVSGPRGGQQAAPPARNPRDLSQGAAGGPRAGRPFTARGRQIIDQRNVDRHGSPTCERCRREVVPGERHQRGVTPPANERQRDHIHPRSRGGDGTPENGQVLCGSCNREKRDQLPR